MSNEKIKDSLNLGEGITSDDLKAAIKASGYPLQIAVASTLSGAFEIQHEWSYVDSDTNILRSLDIVATKTYRKESGDKRIYPQLNLLIECKQVRTGLIFFLVDGHEPHATVPIISDLRRRECNFSTEWEKPKYWTDLTDRLGMRDEPFVKPNDFCFTFSKIVRKNKTVELSGSDIYNSSILPLMKASKHMARTQSPRDTFQYFTVGIGCLICIVDGPLVGVRGRDLKPLKWVRVYRHENLPTGDGPSQGEIFPIDFVSVSSVGEYVDGFVNPFADKFVERALKHDKAIAENCGIAKGMER